MTETPLAESPPGLPEPVQGTGWSDARVGGQLAVVLAALGALLGLAWSAWSPPGPQAEILRPGVFAVLSESESSVAADGRYLIIVAATGIVVALLAWYRLPARRGPVLVSLLCVGALAGALLTELVGHLTGGGSFTGKYYQLSDGTTQQVTLRLPLSLHMQGLLFVEAAAIALIYGVLAAFTARDDLGRPDPVGDAIRARRVHGHGYEQEPFGSPPSVDAVGHPQDGWRDGDAAGPLQQRDLPPQ